MPGWCSCPTPRTNAGLDQISSFRKMMIYEKTGDRFMVLLSAGNLSISQSVREILQTTQIRDRDDAEGITIWNAKSMFDAPACWAPPCAMCTTAMAQPPSARAWTSTYRWCLAARSGARACACSRSTPQATSSKRLPETPYFQVGESKYGKPVLDRVLTPDTPLDEAAKCALVSMDSTLKSNLSVGLPLDPVVYEPTALAPTRWCASTRTTYFRMLHDSWGQKLREVFDSIEDPAWNGGSTQAPS